MSAVSSQSRNSVFELRNATLTLIALVLKTTDLGRLAAAIEERFGATPGLFDHDPVVIDLSQVQGEAGPIDFTALVELLRRRRLLAVGVERGNPEQMSAALDAGLGDSSTFAAPNGSVTATPESAPAAAAAAPIEAPPVAAPAAPIAAPAAPIAAPATTLVIDGPLRSGQQVYARGGDLVVMGAVNFGAEVIADGHIHVYAPLRGRAIAGARGNSAARIFSTCMEPQLVSIAGTYRTLEAALPDDVFGKPAQVRLDGNAIRVERLAS
ncbi:septum site-determining protein MinC [Piscinibacter koreensis]|uniref:Probable septum site-determining protein MinC n=1 Tax=Piscinibacter koreensis TaxID=2742824 RepID=A0A7Y6NPN4_9BURK|nr:septum site-determining protein MinC [Schlegelella koreensis]NUZ06914.1 septum site-determining protein MinC [Schlegelella koreensis]